MPPTLESRVSGDILIPLELNADPQLSILHASVLARLFNLNIHILADPKSKTDGIDNKFRATSLNEPFIEWLARPGNSGAFVIINAVPSEERSKLEEQRWKKAKAVIRDSMVPVLSICKPPVHEKLKSLLLPFDLTRESTLKLSKAIDFSVADSGILIQVISVLFSVDDFVTNKLTRQIEEVRYSLEQKGVLCSAELVKTDEQETHGEVVSEIAGRNENDMVMIMAQLESDKKNSGLHSDVTDILERCPAPVLTINPRG